MTRFDVFQPIPFSRAIRALFSPRHTLPRAHVLSPTPTTFSHIREGMDFFWQRVKLNSNKVIVPAFICPIVPAMLEKNGYEPVFVDVDKGDFNLDWAILESMDLSNIGAIVVSHTLGMPFDVARLKTLFRGLIVEDAAHAWGARWDGRQVGGDGDATFFSCYKQIPNVNGGILVTDNKDWISDALRLPVDSMLVRLGVYLDGPHQRLFSWIRRRKPLPTGDGLESRMPHRLSRVSQNLFALGYNNLEETCDKRAQVASWLRELLGDVMEAQIPLSALASPSYFRFTARLKPEWIPHRDALCLALRKQGIFVDRLWFNAPHNNHPTAQSLATSVINLPLSSSYTQQDVATLALAIRTTLHSLK